MKKTPGEFGVLIDIIGVFDNGKKWHFDIFYLLWIVKKDVLLHAIH